VGEFDLALTGVRCPFLNCQYGNFWRVRVMQVSQLVALNDEKWQKEKEKG
jgi:hypothetical protein